MPPISSSPLEKLRHLRLVEEMAAELGADIDEVREIYQHELDRLRADATVLDYLPVLASRHTREILHRVHG